MNKSTAIDLPREIQNIIPLNERTPLLEQILREAKMGEFHDFRNNKYDCPKSQLVSMLQAVNDERLTPIIQGVINGEYDETPTQEDSANIRQMMIDEGVPVHLINSIIGDAEYERYCSYYGIEDLADDKNKKGFIVWKSLGMKI
jgi:hypothetical protein